MEHDHMVQAVPPNGTNHPLDVGPLTRRARRGQHFFYAMSRTCSLKSVPKMASRSRSR